MGLKHGPICVHVRVSYRTSLPQPPLSPLWIVGLQLSNVANCTTYPTAASMSVQTMCRDVISGTAVELIFLACETEKKRILLVNFGGASKPTFCPLT